MNSPTTSRPDTAPADTDSIDSETTRESDSTPSLSSSSASASGSQSPDPAHPRREGISLRTEVKIFFTTFLTIFVAELGDKTQVTTLLMSAESQAPWVVFLGAGGALILTSLLGVLVGRWLSARVSMGTLETLTGIILMIIAVTLLWDVVHL